MKTDTFSSCLANTAEKQVNELFLPPLAQLQTHEGHPVSLGALQHDQGPEEPAEPQQSAQTGKPHPKPSLPSLKKDSGVPSDSGKMRITPTLLLNSWTCTSPDKCPHLSSAKQGKFRAQELSLTLFNAHI